MRLDIAQAIVSAVRSFDQTWAYRDFEALPDKERADVLKFTDELLSALHASGYKVEKETWRGIETAPSGIDILLGEITDGYVGFVERGFFQVVPEDEDDINELVMGENVCKPGRAAGTYWVCHYEPEQGGPDFTCHAAKSFTHWMPLPPPPNSSIHCTLNHPVGQPCSICDGK